MTLAILLFSLALLGATVAAHPTSSDVPEPRIVGGYLTDVTVHPHQISLRRKSILVPTNSFTHICGGSIIDSDKVLTAAHCIIGSVPSQYKVVAGSNKRTGSDGQIVSVSEIIMHALYNGSTYNNDIAVLILSSPLALNNFTVKAIELADTPPLPGTICTITGWGTTTWNGTSSNDLLAVDVPIVSNEQCDEDYGGGRITPDMLCAGVRGEGGKDACQGDSGGPLTIRNKLYGVVSWGYRCAYPEYPGVYSNVAHLLDWIKSKVQLP